MHLTDDLCVPTSQIAMSKQDHPWAARYDTWLLIKLTPKGVVFSFLFFSQNKILSDLFKTPTNMGHLCWLTSAGQSSCQNAQTDKTQLHTQYTHCVHNVHNVHKVRATV